jgi:hypothetical protein
MSTNYFPCPVRSKQIRALAYELKFKAKNSKGFLEINDQLNKLYLQEIEAEEAFKRDEAVEHMM